MSNHTVKTNDTGSQERLASLLDALVSLDKRLRSCMNDPIYVAEAYDSFYQEVVVEAISKAKGEA